MSQVAATLLKYLWGTTADTSCALLVPRHLAKSAREEFGAQEVVLFGVFCKQGLTEEPRLALNLRFSCLSLRGG